ncbi:hypothetical protein NECAME_13540, partial [Necator americanus]
SDHTSSEKLIWLKSSSSATVREIPVIRSSAVPSAVLECSMPSLSGHHHEDVQDEYYRREIMTKTIITRSTEALSQQASVLFNAEIRFLKTSCLESFCCSKNSIFTCW